MKFDAVYYEPDSLNYPLGKRLKEAYGGLPWIAIENHNAIKEMREKPNCEFARMKRNLIVGTRKTHKYTENHKVSDLSLTHISDAIKPGHGYIHKINLKLLIRSFQIGQ